MSNSKEVIRDMEVAKAKAIEDMEIFGTGFIRIKSDGTFEHIDYREAIQFEKETSGGNMKLYILIALLLIIGFASAILNTGVL